MPKLLVTCVNARIFVRGVMASVSALMSTSAEGGGVGIETALTVNPNRFDLSFQESLFVGLF